MLVLNEWVLVVDSVRRHQAEGVGLGALRFGQFFMQ